MGERVLIAVLVIAYLFLFGSVIRTALKGRLAEREQNDPWSPGAPEV